MGKTDNRTLITPIILFTQCPWIHSPVGPSPFSTWSLRLIDRRILLRSISYLMSRTVCKVHVPMVNIMELRPWKASSTMMVNGRVDLKLSPNPDKRSMRNPPTCTIQWSTNSAEKTYLCAKEVCYFTIFGKNIYNQYRDYRLYLFSNLNVRQTIFFFIVRILSLLSVKKKKKK